MATWPCPGVPDRGALGASRDIILSHWPDPFAVASFSSPRSSAVVAINAETAGALLYQIGALLYQIGSDTERNLGTARSGRPPWTCHAMEGCRPILPLPALFFFLRSCAWGVLQNPGSWSPTFFQRPSLPIGRDTRAPRFWSEGPRMGVPKE